MIRLAPLAFQLDVWNLESPRYLALGLEPKSLQGLLFFVFYGVQVRGLAFSVLGYRACKAVGFYVEQRITTGFVSSV